MSVNIYAGNLSYDLTEAQLGDLFGTHGEVTSVKIITDQYSGRSKGFGFIEMADKDAAETAIKELNGTSVQDREIKVNVARPKNENRGHNSY
ncbi:RNA recognition motif domain-containing protein [Spirochaetota bacterium]